MTVKKGDKIKVEYEGKLEDGTVFDASEKHGQPLEFEAEAGMVVKGFDAAVIGMKKDEEKEITLKPEEAYGDPKAELHKKIPRDQLPKEQEPKVGMVLMVTIPSGQQIPAKIAEVGEKEVTIDLNHPLAGKTLIFKLKVVDISTSEKAEK